MRNIVNIILSAVQWLSAAACMLATALYADGKGEFRYAWAFGMVFLIAIIVQIKFNGGVE